LSEVPGPLYPVFIVVFLWSLVYGTYHLLSTYIRTNGTRKNQLKYVFMAYCFGISGAGAFFLYVMMPNVPPVWYLLEICYSGTIFYAIVRHRLMDINLAFRRLTVHLVYVVLAGAPLVAALLWFRSTAASVLLVLVSLLVGPFLLRSVRSRLTSAVDLLPPFRGKYDYLKSLDEQKGRIASARSADEWGRTVLEGVTALFQPTSGNVLVNGEPGKSFLAMAAMGENVVSELVLPQESLLAEKLRGKRKLVFQELLKADYPPAEAERLGRDMDALRAHLSVPFFVDGELKAVLNIGPKSDGRMYNELDISAIWGLVNAAEVTLRALLLADDIVRKERLAAMGEIASIVGHEIRNALTAISHSVYVLENKGMNPSAQRHLDIINAQLASSQRIIGDILNCVRHRRLALARASVNALAREVIAEAALPERISPLLKLAPGLPDMLIDKDEMKHALFNLIRNAVEAMAQGGILRVESAPSEGGGVCLMVADEGCGIPREELGRIFTPLHSTKARGTGLGLMVVKNVVERHGGKVSVESVPGAGTTFRIFLPMEYARHDAVTVPANGVSIR